jgi:polar amino acid transport system permease protein
MSGGHFDTEYFWAQLVHPQHVFLAGLGVTLLLGVSAQSFGFAIGLATALARMSPRRLLNIPATAYIWVIRGTPLLVQIMFLYTGLAAAGILRFSDFSLGGVVFPGNLQAAMLALALHEGAYMAEILRAGMLAVPCEQIEAAMALGAGPGVLLRRIILPQGLRIVLPALGNQFNSVLKNTTLVSIIGVSEMLLATETIDSVTFRTFELYAVLAIYFLLLTSFWNLALLWVERRTRYPGAAPVRAAEHAGKNAGGREAAPSEPVLRPARTARCEPLAP